MFVVSEGRTIVLDARTQGGVTIRDAADKSVAVHESDGRAVVTAVRMRPGTPFALYGQAIPTANQEELLRHLALKITDS